MRSRIYKNILWFGLMGVMVFAPLAKGAVGLWSITLVETVVAVLVFLWLWRFNNRREIASVASLPRNDGKGKVPRNDEGLRKTKLDLPLWLFVALAGVSCVFSIYKHASVLEMLRLMTMVGVFYLVMNNFDRNMALRLVTLVMIMGTGMSLLGLGQYSGWLEHFPGITSRFVSATYVNYNHFAGYLELAIPLAIGMLLVDSLRFTVYGWRKLIKPGLVVALVIMFMAFIFSQSRGGWVSLITSLVVMNIVLVRKRVFKKESLVILLLLIALGVVFICGGYDAVAKRLRTVEEWSSESSLKGRVKIWQGSMNMIKANPLIGTGIGTLVWGFPGYRPEGTMLRRMIYAHNDYLHMMAEIGTLALPLMLWMIWVVVGAGFRRKEVGSRQYGVNSKVDFGTMDGIVLGSAVGILSVALHGLVDGNFHIPANMLVVACLAGIIMRRSEMK